ncbi:hypothetical protein D5274_02715 [bacterium 1XD42-94]|nr:hypothetical protein [bacterium 1XD42-76]NBK04104.1 hypothetical protein [bacterium 1XD42-94]
MFPSPGTQAALLSAFAKDQGRDAGQSQEIFFNYRPHKSLQIRTSFLYNTESCGGKGYVRL